MRLAIITVPYITSDTHYNLAKSSYDSFKYDGDVLRVAVVNQVRSELSNHAEPVFVEPSKHDMQLIEEYNDVVIHNQINCLGRAWNIGIKYAIEQGCDMFYIPNLDVVLRPDTINQLVDAMQASQRIVNTDWGIASSTAVSHYTKIMFETPTEGYTPIINHDQSFSSFLITKECFEKVGDFYEFKPAYYEDCDYLWRAQQAGFNPTRVHKSVFFHYGSGTVRHNEEWSGQGVPNFEQNGKLYIEMWGGKPNNEVYKTRYNK